jgi:predicted enzyme related to lactoylglutathione lyase
MGMAQEVIPGRKKSREVRMRVSFAHTNIVAHDWRRLASFYTKVFGCTPKPPERDLSGRWLEDLTAIPDVQIQGIHLLLPGFGEDGPTLEIFQYNGSPPHSSKSINAPGFAHIAFAVDDVEGCLKKVLDHGGSTVGETVRGTVEGVGPIHIVYAKDPEGNIIEIQTWE